MEDQGGKQLKVLEKHRKQLIMSSGEKDSLVLLKQKEIFAVLVNEGKFEIDKQSEQINFNNLTYHNEGKSAPKYFMCFKGPLIIYNDINNGRINLQKEEKFQEDFQSELRKILKRNLDRKTEDHISAIKNIKKLYKGQEKVIKFYNTRIISEDNYKQIDGEGLKILTPK